MSECDTKDPPSLSKSFGRIDRIFRIAHSRVAFHNSDAFRLKRGERLARQNLINNVGNITQCYGRNLLREQQEAIVLVFSLIIIQLYFHHTFPRTFSLALQFTIQRPKRPLVDAGSDSHRQKFVRIALLWSVDWITFVTEPALPILETKLVSSFATATSWSTASG